MFFLESKTIPGSLSFCYVIALKYSLSFLNLSGDQSLHPVSTQRKGMKFPLMMFEWAAVMSAACMKKNGVMVLMKKFQLKKLIFW